MIPFTGWRAVGKTLRWARHQYGAELKFTVDRASGERTIRIWTATGTDVWTVWDDNGLVTIKVETRGQLEMSLYTQDVTLILSCLAALDVIPLGFSAAFHRGQLAGQIELVDDLAGTAAVIAAADGVWEQGFDDGRGELA